MRRLDPWAERELASQLAENMWSGHSRMARAGLALACTTPVLLLGAAIAYLAAPAWWWIVPPCILGIGMLALLPYILAPEATIRFLFRAGYVSDEDARKPPMMP